MYIVYACLAYISVDLNLADWAASVAQLAEHWTSNPVVMGSNPIRGSSVFFFTASLWTLPYLLSLVWARCTSSAITGPLCTDVWACCTSSAITGPLCTDVWACCTSSAITGPLCTGVWACCIFSAITGQCFPCVI